VRHVLLVAAAWLLLGSLQPAFDPLRGSLPARVAQPIYSADLTDPWNQAFFLLFTRTVPARLPADDAPAFAAGDERLPLSDRHIVRVESGDRAIDPLYPSWLWMGSSAADFDAKRQWRILEEPDFPALLSALEGIARTASGKPPLARALMQADLWSAFDMVHTLTVGRAPAAQPARAARAQTLEAALATAIGKLALTSDEITRLPDNYRAAVRARMLPDVFSASEGWSEIRWFPTRHHDTAAGDRRATRVFIRPRKTAPDLAPLLQRLRDGHGEDGGTLETVALVTQLLLVTTSGRVVPSPLTSSVQLRGVSLEEHEISRRLLLTSPASGGFSRFDAGAAVYLPMAGNDFSFATPGRLDGEAVIAPLAMRCAVCHGKRQGVGSLVTFSVSKAPGQPVPPVVKLDPLNNVHARDVANRKAAREDFRALQARLSNRAQVALPREHRPRGRQ